MVVESLLGNGLGLTAAKRSAQIPWIPWPSAESFHGLPFVCLGDLGVQTLHSPPTDPSPCFPFFFLLDLVFISPSF